MKRKGIFRFKMSTENKDGKNVSFKFKHLFTNITTGKSMNSPEFESPEIPGVKFFISADIIYHSNITVKVIKNDIRKAVSIIKIEFDGLNSTKRVVDWKDILYFEDLNIPFDFDGCSKYKDFPNFCSQPKRSHVYTVPITCIIIWNGFVEDLYYPDVSTILKILHNNEEFSPIVIKVEKTEFIAHKNIIAAQSSVFYKKLTSDMKESNENSITFPDTEPDVINELLLFFYKGKMDKAETDAELALKLFEFAHRNEIERVISTCEYILITKLTKENVSKIHAKGQLYKSVILQQHAIAFIEKNASKIRKYTALELPPRLDCSGSTSGSTSPTSEILPSIL
ncbi:hypothetical protein KQX54_009710 [Cotesia glomerata]|uniref:BTB domain-containing protein n=1 Tax=Cotesia glomerata TaxID=32391 RepID=A0AAV7IJ09_COTGL|nr:hypothetical protein KQX54_009710 [Cotesia glomerata]